MEKHKTIFPKRKFFMLLCILFSSSFCYSQKQDSAKAPDSLKVYKKIKHWAAKYHYTRLLFEAVFVNPEPQEYPADPVSKETKKQKNPYIKQEKKIIKNIHITVYDPFGNCFSDTACKRITYFEKVGNRAHLTTRHWIISNRLLFKKNDSINPLALSETERLLREAVFVNDAKVFITKTENPDSVDVNVLVIDKWAITIPVEITDVSGNIRFRNQNLLGLGQQFEQYARFRKPDILEYNGFYNISNIDNTYIAAQLGYHTNQSGTRAYINFDRPFYSPLVKIAWGASVNHSWRYFSYTDSIDSIPRRTDLKILGYDVWASRNFKFKKDKTIFNQSTNIIVGARNYSTIYLQRPPFEIDKTKLISNSTAYVGNIGLAVQQYYKDKYIFRFGANEDVPEGFIAQFIYGGLKQEFSKLRYYVGGEIARAKHFNFGYMTATLSYGIFFNKKVSNDITTNFRLYYFSNLVRKGRWLFRQFFDYKYVHGQNKLNGETLTLSSEELYGFQSQSLTGRTKMVLNSETVAYAPYSIIGFRFAPVFQIGIGMVGDPASKIESSRLFQGYTFGIMIRNENLVSSTFHFSVGMYPFFPEAGNYQFIYNPVTSFTLRVRAFSVSRPEFVSYN